MLSHQIGDRNISAKVRTTWLASEPVINSTMRAACTSGIFRSAIAFDADWLKFRSLYLLVALTLRRVQTNRTAFASPRRPRGRHKLTFCLSRTTYRHSNRRGQARRGLALPWGASLHLSGRHDFSAASKRFEDAKVVRFDTSLRSNMG